MGPFSLIRGFVLLGQGLLPAHLKEAVRHAIQKSPMRRVQLYSFFVRPQGLLRPGRPQGLPREHLARPRVERDRGQHRAPRQEHGDQDPRAAPLLAHQVGGVEETVRESAFSLISVKKTSVDLIMM